MGTRHNDQRNDRARCIVPPLPIRDASVGADDSASGKSSSTSGTGLSTMRREPSVNVILLPFAGTEARRRSLDARRSVSCRATSSPGVGRRNVLDHLGHFVRRISVMLCIRDEVLDLAQHLALLWCADDSDSSTTSKLQEPFVTKYVHRPQRGVLVHAENCGDVFDQRQPITGSSLALGNGSANFGSNLIVQWDRAGPVHLHEMHSTSYYRTIVGDWEVLGRICLVRSDIASQPGDCTPMVKTGPRSIFRRGLNL